MQKYLLQMFLFILLPIAAVYAQQQVVVSGAGTAATNGTYTEAGTANSRPYYTMGIYRIEYRNGGFGLEWEIWDTTEPNPSNEVKYYNSSTGNTPVISGWQIDVASPPAPAITNLINFTDGTGYTAPTGTPGTNNNPIGRFTLDPGADGSNLTAVTVNFSGSASGVNAVKLWSSTDATFNSGSDVQLSSKTFGASVTFNSFSSAISRTGTYYFITFDLAGGASGDIFAQIPSQASLTVTSGSMQNTFTNSGLSSGSSLLPVELSSFTASVKDNAVLLKWETVTEKNNSGFDVEKKAAGSNEWKKIAFIEGNGNSNSVKSYSYTDTKASGKIIYRLKQVDNDGSFIYSKEVEVSAVPDKISLNQNYPNPFNPATFISFALPQRSFTSLKIYNILGEEVAELVNKVLEPGSYSFNFDASGFNSGVYVYQLQTGSATISKKMILMK